MSNSPEVLAAVPPDHHESELSLLFDGDGSVKTIGLLWQPSTDTFGVCIAMPNLTEGATKRKVLSSIARIFDPLGWLFPVTIRPKILMQELWRAKLGWDEPLPQQLRDQWVNYCHELQTLEDFRLPRCIAGSLGSSGVFTTHELHGFSDASQAAYSACVYVRTMEEDGICVVNLVAAKSKVAPVKAESIPRLELCGGLLLSKLMTTVQTATKLQYSVIRCWTDSTIVLDWIKSTKRLAVFEGNRTQKIQALFPPNLWHHVPGDENPADCASRGISASALLTHPLWLSGPPWLSTKEFSTATVALTATTNENSAIGMFIQRCSSFNRMKRVIGFCLRFIHNVRFPRDVRTGWLTTGELNCSLLEIVACVQEETFKADVTRLRKLKQPKSSIKFLAPFVDKTGILRVGGRLHRSSLSFNRKHPILLPKSHQFTTVVVDYFHQKLLHPGPQLLLAAIREQFWIIRGPDVVRRAVRRCVTCHRQAAKTANQIMGQLPSPRIIPSRPFSQCGMDYAGPFQLTLRAGRNPPTIKAYVALFVCMATTAIHLEVATDLSTPTFLAALTRFISRRGMPLDIFSDGGKNFVGAKNEMEEVTKFLNSNPHQAAVTDHLTTKGINFHINPPLSPHHGGLWEAGVKSMKLHLRRIMSDRKLTLEEFSTLLCQVEACLNSCPLTALSSDPHDFGALTPGHFLIGDPLTATPQLDLTHLNVSHLSRWQLTQQLSQHFWKRWSTEYLSRLQSRPKWLQYFGTCRANPGSMFVSKVKPDSWQTSSDIPHDGGDGDGGGYPTIFQYQTNLSLYGQKRYTKTIE